MNQYKSEMELNPNLRRQYKLQVERDELRRRRDEIRPKVVSQFRLVLLSGVIVTGIYILAYPQLSLITALILGAASYLLSNFKRIYGVVQIWREEQRLKKEIWNWDEVIREYEKANRED